MNKNKKNTIFISIIIIIIVLMIKKPTIALTSAKEGLYLWFNIILPSLLPFFILSDILISLGFVQTINKLIQPLMMPLFNISGAGAFPLLMSLMSGYPVGSKLTSRLREKNLITKTEGDRLISFASTSGPLFILGAVLVGMLNNPQLSYLMIIPHYLGSLTIGLVLKYYKHNEKDKNVISGKLRNDYENIKKQKNNAKENDSIGSIISRSIKNSIDSTLLIGGFVIIYSVIIDLVTSSNAFNLFAMNISNFTSLDTGIIKGLVAGIIELTTGCRIISIANIPLIYKIILINFLIGWGGLSIHSQALSFITNTDIDVKIYLISKFFHGILSAFYTFIFYVLFFKSYIPTLSPTLPIYAQSPSLSNWLLIFRLSIQLSFSIIIFSIILSFFISEVYKEKTQRFS